MREVSFRVRAAVPADVLSLMRLKRALAVGEGSLHAVRATVLAPSADLRRSLPRQAMP
jgi:hypothetical protein